jgi:hypothetical protein
MHITKKLTSNTDLHAYLLSLKDLLAGRGSQELAESIGFAAKQGAGLGTEFLGESLIALRTVLDKECGVLRCHEKEELLAVISQVEFALRR